MQNWIQANGGPVASVVVVLASFNFVMTAVKTLCDKLKIQEPSALQKAAAIGSTIAGWLSANSTPKQPPKSE